MKIGFTGTQKGMTVPQLEKLYSILDRFRKGTQFHHGDCIGADCQAGGTANSLGYLIIIHPPNVDTKRAFCYSDETLPPKPYLDRNKDIVDATDFLIASPGEKEEQLRSGTWSTVRYARKKNKRVMIIFPDGICSIEA